ncbi:hypothetical protein GGE43_005034 [Agrobacterium tumefaciens]|jgi:hypothetical protein|uniref:DUF4260 domain-containing protein n=1 Tax=Agrobacterium radiobacter TaxID=362 RepID=A0ABR6JE23_AGRRD|nr:MULTISPECIES: DUF4260 domain-containing protein [Agrobacterium tumefaciens complex]MBB4321262.1 hypothetical protein [Agrobacterium radiobacter]MBB4338302.1 hypothetical protein [Agrobacterium radiobacter]MBB4493190.1 hypothetical protein [Agrobacterium radiobacter]MBB4498463.1 hypothetical protein [Agrobacterium radiobacter]MBB4503838.1 hypothetical protein [Agrobacterium radiobacter]
MTGSVTGAPKALLRLEGLGVLVVATVLYASLDASWWLFAALIIAPDLSMVGYIANKRVGAALYNAAHWYVPPLALIAGGIVWRETMLVTIGLVWAAHIGLDRALGYGLKYGEGFGMTHLETMRGRMPQVVDETHFD